MRFVYLALGYSTAIATAVLAQAGCSRFVSVFTPSIALVVVVLILEEKGMQDD